MHEVMKLAVRMKLPMKTNRATNTMSDLTHKVDTKPVVEFLQVGLLYLLCSPRKALNLKFGTILA